MKLFDPSLSASAFHDSPRHTAGVSGSEQSRAKSCKSDAKYNFDESC